MRRARQGAAFIALWAAVIAVFLAFSYASGPPGAALQARARRDACEQRFAAARAIDDYRGVASSWPSQEQMDICIGGVSRLKR